MTSHQRGLTSGALLARNAVWNLAGQAAPLVVAVVTIPVLLRALGVDRFGLLTLAWLVTGYFSVFDLGLGRALTQIVARKAAQQDHRSLARAVATGLALMLLLGGFGAAVLAALTPWLAQSALNIPAALREEAKFVFYCLAVSVPMVVGTSACRGVLEGLQRFRAVSVIRMVMGALTFATPLAVLTFTKSLPVVVAALVAMRGVIWLVHLWFCIRALPAATQLRFDGSEVGAMVKLGSWMTVSNVVGPLLNYVDRFVITAALSVAALTYYATPYELVTKTYVIPVAITGVLFPAFAASLADRAKAGRLFHSGVTYTLALLFPVLFVLSAFADELLTVWLGARFAREGALVLQVLSLSIFVNSLALTPYALLQGFGKASWTAWLHVIQLPVTIALLLVLVRGHGVNGAAWATLLRFSGEAVLLFVFAYRVLPEAAMQRTLPLCLVACASFIPTWIMDGLLPRALFVAVAMPALLFAVWAFLSTASERAALKAMFTGRRTPLAPVAENTAGAS